MLRMTVFYGHAFPTIPMRCGTRSSSTANYSNSTRIEVPLENDILFGRGHRASRHIGNVRFRELILRMKPLYKVLEDNNNAIRKRKTTTKFKQRKTLFTVNLVNHVVSCGGRFLVRDEHNGVWVLAEYERVRVKVGQALRDTII